MTNSRVYYLLGAICGAVALGALAFAFVSLGDWYIDDAGISLAYARNLARDGAMVAQAGDLPVEGYSNPLWVAINAIICFIFGKADLLQTRIAGAAILLFCLLRLLICFARNGKEFFKWNLLFALVVLQPSIVVYSLSGLENSLLVLFSIELLLQAEKGRDRSFMFASLAAAALALTRPDAIVYVAYFPILIWFGCGGRMERVKRILKFSIFPGIAILAYLIFRIVYFGKFGPNTFYAKGLPFAVTFCRLATFSSDIQSNLLAATVSAFGQAGCWMLLLSGAWIILCGKKTLRLTHSMLPSLLLAAMGAFCFVSLPPDWMPLFRFATVYFVGTYAIVAHVACERLSAAKGVPLALIVLSSCIFGCCNGIRGFIARPPISTEEVSARGCYFANWGKLVGIGKPSLLTADAGGILLDEKVRLVDLGMLCDAKIADALGNLNKKPQRRKFHDYVFEDVRPTFIATRAYHSYLAGLDLDDRFRRDYVPIHEYIDLWILNRYGVVAMSGDYVRKDAVADFKNELDIMKQQSEKIYYPFENSQIGLNGSAQERISADGN